MVNDNLTTCYEAIQRIYRNAIVSHLRQALTHNFGEAAAAKIENIFRKEWISIKAVASERHMKLSSPIVDSFDMLGVNHFYNIFDTYFDLLCPAAEGTTDRTRGQTKLMLLAWMKEIKNLRDSMSHPTESDFDDDDAIHMLYCDRKVLESLGLKGAAVAVHDSRRGIDQKSRALDLSTKINLLQRILINGRPIHYLDNAASSKPGTIVFYLHGLGLDCRDFYAAMNSSYRSIAPTMAGFYPGDPYAVNLDLAGHCACIGKFIDTFVESIEQVSTVILVGFSIGADIAFQVLRDAQWIKNRSVGLIGLDCNINSDTCFISKELAGMDALAPITTVVRIAQRNSAANLSDLRKWLAIHEYLVKVFKKQERNLAPLKALAIEFKNRFDNSEPTVFLDSCRALTESGIVVRCIFSDDDVHRNFIASITSPTHQNLFIELQEHAGHFDLIEEAIRLEEYVKDMVAMADLM